jgi:DNA-binding transcriptional MerR regulator
MRRRSLEEIKKLEYIRQSELADLNNIRPSTIKYYSEMGILPYKQHGQGLSKFYHREEASKRIEEILELKKKGKSINEIIEYYIKKA